MIQKNLGRFIFLSIVQILLFQNILFAKITFTQEISKDKIYLNETIKVTLRLLIDKNETDTIDQVDLREYETFDFWIQEYKTKIKSQTKDKWIYTYEYLLDPKKEGIYELPIQTIRISSEKIRKFKRWKKVFSNPKKIKVMPLVDDLPIFGSYTIDFKVNKSFIKANEPIRGVLYIKGKGNLKDLKKYDLSLENQSVFSDDFIIKSEYKNNIFEGNASQEFLIITNTSFTIPPFSLEYFNPFLKEVQKIQTKPVFIEVQKEKLEKKDPPWMKYIFAIFGIFIGVLIFKYYRDFSTQKQIKNTDLYKKIKKTKNDRELYRVLVQNNASHFFDTYIVKLERNIYYNENNRVEKKEILKNLIPPKGTIG